MAVPSRRLRATMVLCFTLLVLALLPGRRSGAQAQNDQYRPLDTILDGLALTNGQHDGTSPSRVGIVGAPGSTSNFTTVAIKAPQPFTDLLLRWEAEEPEGSHLHLEVRASEDGVTWTKWGAVEESDDLREPEDPPTLHWGMPLYAGKARFWQVRATFEPAADGGTPTLTKLTMSTVDVGETPPEQRVEKQQPQSADSIGRPPVYFRTDWGNPQGEESPAAPPDYYRATHLVVHHTAGSNSLTGEETWWGDRVRSIWSFHTYTRGWNDIGYNFLISPDGKIFEGRAGAYPNFTSDPVGFHDTGNYGSMGVSLIGTYSSVQPTAAAQDALVELLAWKADQRGIDPLGSSYYYGCDISRYCNRPGAVTPNIAGHRDVKTDGTECPGQVAYDYLPTIRSRVSQLLGGRPENGDNVIDNLETGQNGGSGFYTLKGSWHSAACGDAGQSYYTYNASNSDQSTNAAKWRKTNLTAGKYRIFVRIPQGCGIDRSQVTTQARYKVFQAGNEIAQFTISQATSAEWLELTATSGPLQLAENPDTPGYAYPVEVHLSDLTGEAYLSKVIYFDSVRFVKEVPPGKLALQNVQYERTTLGSGDILKVIFTLKNVGSGPLELPTQGPAPGSVSDPSSGYVYDEAECFLGNTAQSYPAYPKETGRFRVMLGYEGYDKEPTGCVGGTADYPWRWGVSVPPHNPDQATLQAGETLQVVGYVRMRQSRTLTLRAGLINEYVDYPALDVAPQTITVTPERRAPQPQLYSQGTQPSQGLQPLARVYELKPIPDSFLARTANPLSISEGAYVGSFAWDGSYQNWGSGGPLERTDMFMVLQTRVIEAPVSGEYTFELRSDDGSWLWLDGQPLIRNHGLHPERVETARVWLDAGGHILSLKYFERGGQAALGYRWQLPGASEMTVIPESIGGAPRSGSTIGGPLMVVADDQGGSGVSGILWSLDGGSWQTMPGSWLVLNQPPGQHTLRYRVRDHAGNLSLYEEQVIFTVEDTPPSTSLRSVWFSPTYVLNATPTGSDNLAGIAQYWIEIYDQTSGLVWRRVVAPGEVVRFIGEANHTYELRSQGVDRVGNVEPRASSPDAVRTFPGEDTWRFYRQRFPLIGR